MTIKAKIPQLKTAKPKVVKAKPVKAIPTGYHTITPYLCVDAAAKLIDFLKKAFDAKVVRRSDGPGGTVMNAEVKVGNSMIMVADAPPERRKPVMIYMYVEDTDAVYKKAIKAGAKSQLKPTNMFYGDRNAGVEDSSGNQWWFATHIEDVSDAEISKRAAKQKH